MKPLQVVLIGLFVFAGSIVFGQTPAPTVDYEQIVGRWKYVHRATEVGLGFERPVDSLLLMTKHDTIIEFFADSTFSLNREPERYVISWLDDPPLRSSGQLVLFNGDQYSLKVKSNGQLMIGQVAAIRWNYFYYYERTGGVKVRFIPPTKEKK